MVQVLPYVPSFGERLAPALGQFGANIGEGLETRRLRKEKEQRQVEAQRPRAQSFLTSLLKQQGAADAYDPEKLLKARERANEYIDKGYDSTQAVFSAYDDLVKGFPEGGKTKVSQVLEGAQQGQQSQPTSLAQMIGNKGSPFQGQSVGENPLWAALSWPIDKLKNFVGEKNKQLNELNKTEKEKEAKKGKGFKLNKPIEELTNKELLELPAEYVNSLPMDEQRKVGKKIADAAKLGTDFAFASGLIPGGVVQGAERKLAEKGISPIPEKNQATQGALAVPEALGTLIKDLGIFKAAGKGANLGEKVALGASGFGAETAAQKFVGEGRHATAGEIAKSAAFGAGGELIGPVAKAGLNFIKKIPRVYESIKASAAATRGAVTETKIVQEAVKNLEARGVSVVKAAQGDAKALNEIQKESAKVADTYKQAEKYNRKEIEKIRGEKAEKLVQSPLEKYYAPVKEVAHRPETIAKEAARIKPLEVRITQSERSLRNLQYQILNDENYLKEAAHKLDEAQRTRIRALIDHNKMTHQRHLNEIRSAAFEIKYGKPPMTTAQIKEQIGKSFDEIRAGIKDPSVDKIKKMEKALEQNKAAVEQAQKLVERGEIPGPAVFDEYIKIKQEYVKAYGDLIEELGNFIKESKGEKALASQVENARKLKQLVQQTREQSKASIVNQIDKRKAMKTLEGASGALWKNLLKDVRTDVDAFQKEWASVRKTLSPQEIKTAQTAKKSIETQKTTPKPLGAAEEAKSAAIKKKADTELKSDIDAFHERLKTGKTTEKDVVRAGNATSKYLKRLQAVPKGLAKGAVAGVIQSIYEEYTGSKIPIGLISVLIPGSAVGRGSAFGGTLIGHKITNAIFDHIEEEKLRKLRNTEDFHKYRKDLERRYSKARVNRLVKASGQSK